MSSKIEKALRCPVCGRGRVCDAGTLLLKETALMWQHDESLDDYDIQVRCPICKSLIDIKINKSA